MSYRVQSMIQQVVEGADPRQVLEGSDLYCPNCEDKLGKQSEVEWQYSKSDKGSRRGTMIRVFCGRCGHKWKHRTEYDTRD